MRDPGRVVVLTELSDVELRLYAELVTSKQRKQLAIVMGTAMLMLIPFGLAFFAADTGLPLIVPIACVVVLFIACIPMLIQHWRLDQSRLEAVVELARRGIELPPGTPARAARPAVVEANRRTALPAGIGGTCVALILMSVALLVAGALPEIPATYISIFVLLAVVLACIIWIMIVLITTARAEGPQAGDHPRESA